MRVVAVSLDAVTSLGHASYHARMEPGLNVLSAPNSWGKSTLLQSIVYALGLEGALSASNRVPLGPAMTQVIQTPRGRGSVSESYVTLTLVNDRRRYLRVRRWAKSLDVNVNLVQVVTAESEEGLERAKRQDMYVRRAGATSSEVGFHRLLEEFLGWSLPLVPGYSGTDVRLYLEVIFPLFYIEQKFGWSGVAPRVPTHFRIRNPLQRAVEYTLGLSTLELIRTRQALREEEAAIGSEWRRSVGRLIGAANAEHIRVIMPDERPVPTGQRHQVILEANDGERWLQLEATEARWRERLASIGAYLPTAGELTARSRADLSIVEGQVRKHGAVVRDLREQLAASRADQDALAARLASIETDRRHLADVQRIRSFGGELELPLIAEGRCPTCQQNVDDREVATGTVSSLEENVMLLNAERVTLIAMQTAALQKSSSLEESVSAAEADLSTTRDQVRLLRDELTGPSNAPSLSQVQERLTLEDRLRRASTVRDICTVVEHELDELSIRIEDVHARRAALGDADISPDDSAVISEFRNRFLEQIESYGLRSVPPRDVTIDERSLLPSNDGFELSFDLAMGISASDTIRTKWAYHTALFETASFNEIGHSLGLLVLDEPRQQETEHQSLAAFLSRLDSDRGIGQILYATSEDPDVLHDLLSGIIYNQLPSTGPNLLTLDP